MAVLMLRSLIQINE